MRFKIDNQIFGKFPGLNIGVVIAKGVNNFGSSGDIQQRTRELEQEIRNKHSLESLSQNQKIDAWRKAYYAFGAKPKDYKSSVENLYRLVLQGLNPVRKGRDFTQPSQETGLSNGANLRSINKLVDIYNFISLKYILPVGGEDTDKMQGEIALVFAGQNEPPVLLLGAQEPHPPHQGEVIYKDALSAVCRRWNWREADRTKLTRETTNCLLVIEGLPPATKEEIEQASKDLKELVGQYCGGEVLCATVNESKPEIEF